VPYTFAHPAAVIPIAAVLGRSAVPSALVIGSMIPDAWYFVPFLDRDDSHDLMGILWFCLPAGLLAYTAFHLIFKQPMLALLPRDLAGRLAAWTTPGMPAVPRFAVLVSLLAGIATHLVWDALTHPGPLSAALPVLQAKLFGNVYLHGLLQHASTLLGTAFLARWILRKLRATKPQAELPEVHPLLRVAVLAVMVVVPAFAFVSVVSELEPLSLRTALRAGGLIAVSMLGFVALFFCLASQWRRA
jgi:Domain of unknown function (DUF4184)